MVEKAGKANEIKEKCGERKKTEKRDVGLVKNGIIVVK